MGLPPLSSKNRQGGLYLLRLSPTHYYVGRAKQFRMRWRRHLTALKKNQHTNPYMQAVFNKYGQFDPEILEVHPSIEAMIAAEKLWLIENFGKEGCLNLSERPTNNTYLSPEAREKISKAHKGRKMPPEAIRRSAESRRGLKQSEEHRRKSSLCHRGLKHTEEAKRKMSRSSARKGKPITETLRQAIIVSNQQRKGEKRPAAVRRRLSDVFKDLVWVCYGAQSRRVPLLEVPALLEQGWQRGRKYKTR